MKVLRSMMSERNERNGASLTILVHILLISVLALLTYAHTLDAPFQWDDKALIEGNPIVRNLHYFVEPSTARELPEYGIFHRRYVSMLSFALNYRLHGLDVRGYHAVNVTIHFLTAILVYAFIRSILRTPFFRGSSSRENPGIVALVVGLFFVSHPVQTEAVTYIMARFATLAALWYMLSLVLYLNFRRLYDERGFLDRRSLLLYGTSLVAALLAMKTKEISATLPLAVALSEVFFFRGSVSRRALLVVPFFAILMVFPLGLMHTGMPIGTVLFGIDGPEADRGVGESLFDRHYVQSFYPRWEYLITQFRVMVTYLRLLVLPVNQNFDYDYRLSTSLLSLPVLASLLVLFAILVVSVLCYRLSRREHRHLRLISFGILWFFLTLAVESSVLPIPLVIAEYRMYLPSVGILLASTSALFVIADSRVRWAKHAITVLVVGLTMTFSMASYARNSLWRSETVLWSDVVSKSPNKARPHYNLGLFYKAEGDMERAIKSYEAAVRIRPDYMEARSNLGNAYLATGRVERAIEQYEVSLRLSPRDAFTNNNLGNAYRAKGLRGRALDHYLKAIDIKPDYANAYYNCAIVYEDMGLDDDARACLERALELEPENRRFRAKRDALDKVNAR